MTLTSKDLNVGLTAARNWLNQYESTYSGFISDDILKSVVAEVVNAVDAERKSTSST